MAEKPERILRNSVIWEAILSSSRQPAKPLYFYKTYCAVISVMDNILYRNRIRKSYEIVVLGHNITT